MAATKTKTTKSTAKSSAKPKTKPKTKTAAKPKPKPKAPARKMRTVKLASGRKVERYAEHVIGTGTVRNADLAVASRVATALLCTDGDGLPVNRAPFGTVKIEEVKTALRTGKLTTAKAVKLTGAADWKQLVAVADGRQSAGEMAARLKELSAKKAKSGRVLASRKIRGRALAAAVVGLAVADGAKLPTGKTGATAPAIAAAKLA